MISASQAVGVGTAVVVAVVLLVLKVDVPGWLALVLGILGVASGAYGMWLTRKEGRPIVSKDPDDYR
jgi:hypothetical protein